MIIIDSKGSIYFDCEEADYLGYFGKFPPWNGHSVRCIFYKDVLLVIDDDN